MTPSQVLFFFCLFFILGNFLSSFLKISLSFVFCLLLLAIFLISVFWSYKKIFLIGFFILFLVFGILRYQIFVSNLENSKIKNFIGQEVIIFGIVDEEPQFQEKIAKLVIKIDGENAKILIKNKKYPEFEYGDRLKITGRLKEPQIFDNFNYKNYLLKERILAEIDFPETEKIGENFGNPLKKLLFDFKNKFKQKVEEFILPPEVGILEALIFGDESKISSKWKEKLNLTGIRHITAVSGMNITILSYLILNFVLIFGFWRRDAILISLFLIFLYLLMIGTPPSAVRAAIMGSLALIAQYFGRYSSGIRPVLLTGAIMIFQNPLILKFDVGFQLSFLAILGLIYWQQIFFDFFKKIPNSKFFPARSTLAATFSAQIFTLPILIYNFGKIPLISPITNLLIVPFLPHLTIFFLFFGILAIFSWPLAYIFSLPIYIILHLICKIIDFFFKIPFSYFSFKISFFWVLIFYFFLFFATWRVQERQKLKFLG